MSAQILVFPTPSPKDGGKARIERRRGILGLRNTAEPITDDLTMRHADPEDDTGMPSDSPYRAPDKDFA